MQNILYRDKSDLVVLDINEITDDKLIDAFTNSINGTVYITKNDRLEGIITIGDFRRNLKLSNYNLINKNFTVLEEKSGDLSVEEIFRENKKINSIPVINKDKMIIGEYYREINTNESIHEDIAFEIIEEIYFELYIEMMVGGYDCVIVRIDNISEKNNNLINEISNKTNGKIIISKNMPLSDIKKLSNEQKVYILDMGYYEKGLKIRSIYYEKNKIEYISFTKEKEKIKETIKYIGRLYKKIAILHNNQETDYVQRIIKNYTNTEVVLLDIENVKNVDGNIKYMQELEDLNNVEVIFTLTTAVRNQYILYKDKILPYLCIFEKAGTSRELWTEWDIAVNIIPKLEQNNIRTIIINNPENEIDKINLSTIYEKGPLEKAFKNKNFWEDDYKYIDQIKAFRCYTSKKGYIEVENCETEMVNYANGIRYTVGNPQEYNNTVYLFGPCFVRGILVTDRYTLSSFLRKKIGKEYYIENRGNNESIKNIVMRIPTYKPGDIVIVMTGDSTPYKKVGLKIESIVEAYNRIPNLENNIWDSILHANSKVTEYVADEIYNIISDNIKELPLITNNTNYLKFSSEIKNDKDDIPKELMNWLEEIKQFKVGQNNKVGSIVMNCNPFTFGHRYLIEKSKEMVDHLFIFLVEEDRSFFKFEDRIQMVKSGVADLENITVLPSGRYIISTETLPGYFNKDELQSVKLDASNDIDIFGNIIAKCLNISVRFAGEEPLDAFTRQYNETMKRMLPDRGVEFIEIPRICKDEEVISASRVRKLLKEKKYSEIKKLVPITTYEYLEKNYFEL